MRLALDLAHKANEIEEVPVGAVVVIGDELVGQGFNQTISTADPTAHAEILALRDAASRVGNYRLVDASMFVTIEPCTMCAGAMVHARIRHLYFGAREPRAGAVGSTIDVLANPSLNHRIEIHGGICERQSADLMSAFFKARRQT